MSSPFEVATDALFLNSNFGREAQYAADGLAGSLVPVTAIVEQRDQPLGLFPTGARNRGWVAWLRQNEVPEKPRRGAVLTVAVLDLELKVVDTQEDFEQTYWELDLDVTSLAPPITDRLLPFMVPLLYLHQDTEPIP